jgi:hypothetical protein
MAHWLQHSKLAPRFDFNTEGDLKNIALVVPFHPFFPGNIRYGINYLFSVKSSEECPARLDLKSTHPPPSDLPTADPKISPSQLHTVTTTHPLNPPLPPKCST